MRKKKSQGIFEGIVILIGIIVLTISKIISAIFTIVEDNFNIIITIVFSGIGILIAYKIYSEFYFNSKKFKTIKGSISEHIENCNELNQYIEELKGSYVNIELYKYGASEMIDDSIYNFKRKQWNNTIQSNRVHQCSATVCKNASNQPMKYLCKYFNIDKNEQSLSKFEKVLNDFSSVEQGKDLIRKERESILTGISHSIPSLIKRFSEDKLTRNLGFATVDIRDTYIPTFTFQFVSAGGNSSSRCDIKLNIDNLNHLINYLNDVIKWRKSIAGQRALMTSKVRNEIKKRDNYRCCNCNLGIEDEPNLLLEIDHIIPLSKGGMTTYENLQVLCWRCNRTKGAKIISYT